MQPVPDDDLREAVVAKIKEEKSVAVENINVAAEKGVVTLTGFARSIEEKMAAESAAKQVGGVSAIADDIEVKPSYERTDTEIARDILRAFRINVCVPSDRVKVTVRDGQVILEGNVHWQFQKMMAQALVKGLRGIKGIANNIEVRPEEFIGRESEPAEVIVIGGDVLEGGVAWGDTGNAEAG
jgi:osmotically-inducible protein OsmY